VASRANSIKGRRVNTYHSEIIPKKKMAEEGTLSNSLYEATISSVQSLNHVWLFATLWTSACHVPCPSPALGACSNSCLSTQWSHPLLSPSPPAFNLSQHQGLSQWVSSLHQVAKVLELQHQSFQWIFRTDFLYDWLVRSLCSPRDSQESSPTP